MTTSKIRKCWSSSRIGDMTHEHNVFGYIYLGTGKRTDDGDDLPLARNALVFLVVDLNDYLKLSIAYFLIDGMTGAE